MTIPIPSFLPKSRGFAAAAMLAALSLLLSGCFLSPGIFVSELHIKKDGTFSYTYNGGIYLLPLAQQSDGSNDFRASECFIDNTFEERDCSANELADQRAEWEDSKEMRNRQSAQMAASMMGGMDPSDPEAPAQFAATLQRQKGYEKVEYMGDGLFNVSYSISGALSHDFIYPTIEGFPMANYFVLVANRKGEALRIEAPGFGPAASNPMEGMMAGMAGMPGMPGAGGSMAEDDGGATPPEMSGVFRIITDGDIRANNTDEGPQSSPHGQVLEWQVNSLTSSAPTALIQL